MKLSTFLMTAFFCLNFADCHSQKPPVSDEQAIKELRQFYVSYIKEACTVSSDTLRMYSLLQRYSTANLALQLKEQDEADIDFFLDGNTCILEWLKTLTVTKDVNAKDIYVVSYIYNDMIEKNKTIKIRLRLIKKTDGILIDRIIR